MNIKAQPPHLAAAPAEAAAWHRQMQKLAKTERAAEHHRRQAEQLERMADDTEGVWVRVG